MDTLSSFLAVYEWGPPYTGGFHSIITVVKRTRVPEGPLVKRATNADVNSERIRALIQSVWIYTWNVLSREIHGGIRNIRYKTRLWRPFHRCTIAPRKIFLTRVLRAYVFSVSRVTVFFHDDYLRGYLRCARVSDLFFCSIAACFTELWENKQGNAFVNEKFIMKKVSCQSNCIVST